MAAPKAICIVRTETLAKEFIVEPSTPVEEFIKLIAQDFQQNLEKLELLLQNSMCPMLMIDKKTPTLSETGIIFDNEARNVIMLSTNDKKKIPDRVETKTDVLTPTKKFKGLINQSNTCYLNCYLQTLYMLPEIKNRVIKWNVIQDDLCILTQLQKLFIKLEVSDDSALSTKEFTNSFKWVVEHMEDHQDVHEFLGVLLDGIQEASKKHDLEDIVSKFYHGTLLEHLRCSDCNNTKYKDVSFLHIQLPVINMEGQPYDCMENIVKDYTKTELLTGSDQLFCENCNKKNDTEKGHSFKTLPYILNLSLSRFDFDCDKMRVVKISNKISFPLELTICDMENNPFKYELISVIVHKGSPNCGHYFANIKDVSDNEWYLFDDRNVYNVDLEELAKAHGGSQSNTGYVFIYRMIDETKNEMPIKKDDFSEDLKKMALNLKNDRDAVYVFKIHLKRNGKTTVLKKFISFGFNTLNDLRRRVTSHLNVMIPEIDTDEMRMGLYNYEVGEAEKYYQSDEYFVFLCDFMENNGDVTHILVEANKDRPLEEEDISYSSYSIDTNMNLLPSQQTTHCTDISQKIVLSEEEKGIKQSRVKYHVYNNLDHLRNYSFNGKIIVNVDLIKQTNVAKILTSLCVSEEVMNDLNRCLSKMTFMANKCDRTPVFAIEYPNAVCSAHKSIARDISTTVVCNGKPN